jgi:hypothetical protein
MVRTRNRTLGATRPWESGRVDLPRRSRILAAGILMLTGLVVGAAPATAVSCPLFPSNNYWRADIRSLPVHPYGANWLRNMGASTTRLHPDFGPSGSSDPAYGIPITPVTAAHPKVSVTFDYASESDRVGYPLGSDTKIEGGLNSSGDKHAIIVNYSDCRLYETWNTRLIRGRWYAGSGATWSLTSNALRPNGWTSADAAGLPIFPGLVRWREVKAGVVPHAIRFTTNVTSTHHLWPARHDAGSQSNWAAYPPMGARFRLKSTFSEAGYSAYARVVIKAMKIYGLVLADNGSRWFFQGDQDAGWPPSLIAELKKIPASAFVAVDTAKFPHTANSAAVG